MNWKLVRVRRMNPLNSSVPSGAVSSEKVTDGSMAIRASGAEASRSFYAARNSVYERWGRLVNSSVRSWTHGALAN